MEHAIINIIENSKDSRFIDTSIFSSLISFLSFHKIYGMKRGIDINFTIFLKVATRSIIRILVNNIKYLEKLIIYMG
jgi:hypothetical protein